MYYYNYNCPVFVINCTHNGQPLKMTRTSLFLNRFGWFFRWFGHLEEGQSVRISNGMGELALEDFFHPVKYTYLFSQLR